MKAIILTDNYSSRAVNRMALRNYHTYVKHYESRKLKPMPLEAFLKNYNS